MAPNWFIAFPMQVKGLELPPAPRRVRVFEPEDLHATLCFLGAVEETDARRAWEGIGTFSTIRAVRGTFAEMKPLGHPRKPSALAAIVGEGSDAMSEMILEARAPLLTAAGSRPDDRPPLPHMTIARIQRRANGAERGEALSWTASIGLRDARFYASDVALYTWSTDRQTRLFDIVERYPMRAQN